MQAPTMVTIPLKRMVHAGEVKLLITLRYLSCRANQLQVCCQLRRMQQLADSSLQKLMAAQSTPVALPLPLHSAASMPCVTRRALHALTLAAHYLSKKLVLT